MADNSTSGIYNSNGEEIGGKTNAMGVYNGFANPINKSNAETSQIISGNVNQYKGNNQEYKSPLDKSFDPSGIKDYMGNTANTNVNLIKDSFKLTPAYLAYKAVNYLNGTDDKEKYSIGKKDINGNIITNFDSNGNLILKKPDGTYITADPNAKFKNSIIEQGKNVAMQPQVVQQPQVEQVKLNVTNSNNGSLGGDISKEAIIQQQIAAQQAQQLQPFQLNGVDKPTSNVYGSKEYQDSKSNFSNQNNNIASLLQQYSTQQSGRFNNVNSQVDALHQGYLQDEKDMKSAIEDYGNAGTISGMMQAAAKAKYYSNRAKEKLGSYSDFLKQTGGIAQNGEQSFNKLNANQLSEGNDKLFGSNISTLNKDNQNNFGLQSDLYGKQEGINMAQKVKDNEDYETGVAMKILNMNQEERTKFLDLNGKNIKPSIMSKLSMYDYKKNELKSKEDKENLKEVQREIMKSDIRMKEDKLNNLSKKDLLILKEKLKAGDGEDTSSTLGKVR